MYFTPQATSTTSADNTEQNSQGLPVTTDQEEN